VQKSGGGIPCCIGINDEGRRHPQAPTRNFIGLTASRAGGRKGDGGGECGLLIGTEGRRLRQGVIGIKRREDLLHGRNSGVNSARGER
jgi:hypothetical protein